MRDRGRSAVRGAGRRHAAYGRLKANIARCSDSVSGRQRSRPSSQTEIVTSTVLRTLLIASTATAAGASSTSGWRVMRSTTRNRRGARGLAGSGSGGVGVGGTRRGAGAEGCLVVLSSGPIVAPVHLVSVFRSHVLDISFG